MTSGKTLLRLKGRYLHGENIWAYVRHASVMNTAAARAAESRNGLKQLARWYWTFDVPFYIKVKNTTLACIDDYEGYKDTLRIYAYTKDIDA